MEYISDGNLRDFLKSNGKMTSQDVINLAQQMTTALLLLKTIDVIHRDIKPENILVVVDHDGNKIFKLADFGVSRILGPEKWATTYAGTPGYWAPEVRNQSKHDGRCDIFSLGLVLLECATGNNPLAKIKTREYGKLFMDNKLHPILFEAVSKWADSFSSVIMEMLSCDRNTRLTVTDLMARIGKFDGNEKPTNQNYNLSSLLERVFVQNRIYEYSLRHEIGRGAFSRVYRGRQLVSDLVENFLNLTSTV